MRQLGASAARHPRRSMLLVGEGAADAAFLHHTKSVYLDGIRDSGIKIVIKSAYGGSPAEVLKYAAMQAKRGSYDVKGVLLDRDREWPKNAGLLAVSRG